MKRTKAQLEEEVCRLTAELAREQRANLAFQEWHSCEYREETRGLEVGGDTGITVLFRGLKRAAGGVCVVQQEAYRDMPVFLDDLCAEWSQDPNSDVRAASALLQRLRDDECGAVKAS